MSLPIVRYIPGPRPNVIRHTVELPQLEAMARRPCAHPEMFLVPMSQFDALRQLGWLVTRANKQPEIELARYFLNVDGIPLLAADYSTVGKLDNSLWRFLARAEKAGQTKVFFVAVRDELFQPRWRATEDADRARWASQNWAPVEAQAVFLPSPSFHGKSIHAINVRGRIERLGPGAGPVHVSGPPGSGRTLCGILLHLRSQRPGPLAQTSLIMPDIYQRSQLFGVRHGSAFVPGILQQNVGRTVILYDFDWLPLPLQQAVAAACLGPGAPLDVRLILITDLDLETLIERRRICPEFAVALEDAQIRIPSLVERPEDVGVIAEHLWVEASYGQSRLPPAVKEETRRHVFTYEADELRAALATLWDMCAGRTPSPEDFRAALEKSRRTHPAHSTRAGARFGLELEPTTNWIAHLKRVSRAFRELWVSFRPIRQGRLASVTQILDGLARIDDAIGVLDFLFGDRYNFSRSDIYHDILDFKGELYTVRQRASANPHEIGQVWAQEYDERLDREHRRIEDMLAEERARLIESVEFRQ